MSTNHNRIRVADLEKNQPDKILVTNENGELEFSDISSVQTQSYNALDYKTEGKALDARQGKVLKDMIDNVNVPATPLVNDLTTGGTSKALTAEMGKTLENTKLTASLATDIETQITSAVSEDKKVVSRSKLLNWWEWIKGQTQIITGKWTFNNTVTLSSGNTTLPSLIIPNGNLTSTTQNGAIERDNSGKLFTTRNNNRYRLLEDDGSIISLLVNLPTNVNTYTPSAVTNTTTTVIGNIPLGTLPSIFVGRIGLYYSTYWAENGGGSILPTSIKVEYYLRVTNGCFDGYIWGTVSLGVDYLIYSNEFLNTTTHLSTFTKNAAATIFSKRDGSGQNGTYNGIGIQESFRNTRTLDNSNNQDVVNCSFQIVEKITHTYADSTNAAGKNIAVTVNVSTNAFFIEKIR
jgi:hypothetical protein